MGRSFLWLTCIRDVLRRGVLWRIADKGKWSFIMCLFFYACLAFLCTFFGFMFVLVF